MVFAFTQIFSIKKTPYITSTACISSIADFLVQCVVGVLIFETFFCDFIFFLSLSLLFGQVVR